MATARTREELLEERLRQIEAERDAALAEKDAALAERDAALAESKARAENAEVQLAEKERTIATLTAEQVIHQLTQCFIAHNS